MGRIRDRKRRFVPLTIFLSTLQQFGVHRDVDYRLQLVLLG